MYKQFLSTSNGLSMTQPQALSNLCNQRCEDIQSIFDSVNNYSRTVKIDGEELKETEGKPMPIDAISLIEEKGKLHSCQAFIMECIKAKSEMLVAVQKSQADLASIITVKQPVYEQIKLIPLVDEAWAKSKLTASEVADYNMNEALASNFGKFFHKGTVIDRLRKELPTLKSLDWITVEKDKLTPVKVEIHHKAEQLLTLHTALAEKHREVEQKVNYIKAKIKNLVTNENARIAKENALNIDEVGKRNDSLRDEYNKEVARYNHERSMLVQQFESEKQSKIREISSYKINCPQTIQPIIDGYLSLIGK